MRFARGALHLHPAPFGARCRLREPFRSRSSPPSWEVGSSPAPSPRWTSARPPRRPPSSSRRRWAMGRQDVRQGGALTARDLYKRDSPGVVFIKADVVQRPGERLPVRLRHPRAPAGDRDGLGLRHRPLGRHPHERPRHRRRGEGHGPARGQEDRRRPGRRPRHLLGPRAAEGRPGRPGAPAARARLGEGRAGRRPRHRDRQPVRPRPDAHDGGGLRAAAPDHRPERLQDLERHPDRRGDQPGQLGRSAHRRDGEGRSGSTRRSRRARAAGGTSASASPSRSTPPSRCSRRSSATGRSSAPTSASRR